MKGWELAAGAALAALLILSYRAVVARLYRLRTPPPVRLRATCADGGRLEVHYRPAASRRYLEPLLLCHGIATNHLNMDFEPPYSLAHAFAEAGFECYSVDWRGAGASRPPPGRDRFAATVDDLIRWDGPALLARALEHSRSPRAFWLGHSMGALIGYGVAQGPEGHRLKGLAALGAPVFFEYQPWLRGIVSVGTWLAWPRAFRQRWLSLLLAPFLGRMTLPLSDTIINPKAIPPPMQRKLYANIIESIGRPLLLQFRDWISTNTFKSRDGSVDYREGLKALSMSALVVGGSEDRLASEAAVRRQYELLGSTDKTLMVFGVDNGDALEYGHGDLIFGARAPKEIYPRILTWLRERATPL